MDSEKILYRYKYMPFEEGSLKVITEGTLKYTCPLEFNDPFDCMPAYDTDSIATYLNEHPEYLAIALARSKSTPAARITGKQRIVARTKGLVESGAFIRGLVSTVGVLSLSRIPTEILMWSHYTKHHQGFVVEFKIDLKNFIEGEHDLMMPHPVIYSETRPVLEFGTKLEVEEYFLKKSLKWAYEQEERVVTTDEGHGIHSYDRKAFLNCVISGSRMSPSDFKALKKAVKKAEKDCKKKIPIFKSELSPTEYKVIIPGHPNTAHH